MCLELGITVSRYAHSELRLEEIGLSWGIDFTAQEGYGCSVSENIQLEIDGVFCILRNPGDMGKVMLGEKITQNGKAET